MAYNIQRLEFLTGYQYRIYKNPIQEKQYMAFEKDKIKSDRIDQKIIDHVKTPWGDYADEDELVVLDIEEIINRKNNSIRNATNRAKSQVYNYARANDWDWFATITFNKEKVDRYDYKAITKMLTKWLKNVRQNHAPDMKYLFVPELHKDGAYHFHGLIKNPGTINLVEAINPYTGEKIFEKGKQVFNIKSFRGGFTTVTLVEDSSRASSYITKYITKDLVRATKRMRRYYPSLNLDLPPKEYYFYSKEEVKEFLKEIEESITYRKDVKINVDNYDQEISYIEVSKNK